MFRYFSVSSSQVCIIEAIASRLSTPIYEYYLLVMKTDGNERKTPLIFCIHILSSEIESAL
jgi:hypothetical protein